MSARRRTMLGRSRVRCVPVVRKYGITMMRVAPRSTNRRTASGKSGWPSSRKHASIRVNPPRRAKSDVNTRTASFADSTTDPCAKMASPVTLHQHRMRGLLREIVPQEIEEGATLLTAIIFGELHALQKHQDAEDIRVPNGAHTLFLRHLFAECLNVLLQLQLQLRG